MANEHADTKPISFEDSRAASAIFFLLLLVPAVGTVLFGAVDQITWSLFYLVWMVLVLLWIGDAWKRGGLVLNTSALLIPVAGLAVIGVIQLLPIPYLASINPSETWFFELRLIVILTFFVGYLTFIDSEKRLKKAINFIVIFGAAMAFYGILQRLASPDGIYGLRQTPQAIPFGPFVNEHHFAAFMEMTGGLTLGLLFGEKMPRDRGILLTVAIIIMGAAVAFTGSRGGMLAFGSVLAFVLLLRIVSSERASETSGSRHLGAVVGGFALLAIVFTLVLFLGGNDQLLRGTGAATAAGDISTGRFHFWPVDAKDLSRTSAARIGLRFVCGSFYTLRHMAGRLPCGAGAQRLPADAVGLGSCGICVRCRVYRDPVWAGAAGRSRKQWVPTIRSDGSAGGMLWRADTQPLRFPPADVLEFVLLSLTRGDSDRSHPDRG